MELTTREIKEEDIEDILEIEEEAFTTPWSEEAFKSEIKNNLAHYLVVEIDGRVVGYGGVWLIIDEAHITNIAVLQDYKGKGIGNKILTGLIEYSTSLGIRNMTLEVRESNFVARRLYEKHGFVSYGIRPKYYVDDNEDAIIMWRVND